jgi:hypothetical protein
MPGLDVVLSTALTEKVIITGPMVADDDFGSSDLLQVFHREVANDPDSGRQICRNGLFVFQYPYNVIFFRMILRQIQRDILGTAAVGLEIVRPEDDLILLYPKFVTISKV